MFFKNFSEDIVTSDIPSDIEEFVKEKRHELIETVSEVDDTLADAFLCDEPISPNDLEVCFGKIKKMIFFYAFYINNFIQLP